MQPLNVCADQEQERVPEEVPVETEAQGSGIRVNSSNEHTRGTMLDIEDGCWPLAAVLHLR